jgi:NAD(P)H-nitrite reductase large subunit
MANINKHICIIGNGIAGITAARHIRKLSDYQITVISSESTHFYSRTALMYIFMGHMKFEHTKPYEDWFWAKNRINLIFDHVQSVDFSQDKINMKANGPISYDYLILATGSLPNKFNWPGQNLNGVQGLYSLQDLALLENNTKNTKKATIIGGGLIGIELAEMLISRKIEVTFLARENHFWDNVLPEEEAIIIEKEIKKHNVNLLLNTELEAIIGNETNQVIGIKTKQNIEIHCDFVGLTVGVSPNITFIKNTNLATNKGILVNEYLQTNLKNVYAIGDCVEHTQPPAGRRAIEQIWYTGKIMGETLAKTICGTATKYEPGIYYNSAKFFDLDYSVYGDIPNTLPIGINTFLWQNNESNKCIRINYDQSSGIILGLHALGIRLRQSTCMDWLKNKTKIQQVVSEIENGLFDPEFTKNYSKEIKESFTKPTYNVK